MKNISNHKIFYVLFQNIVQNQDSHISFFFSSSKVSPVSRTLWKSTGFWKKYQLLHSLIPSMSSGSIICHTFEIQGIEVNYGSIKCHNLLERTCLNFCVPSSYVQKRGTDELSLLTYCCKHSEKCIKGGVGTKPEVWPNPHTHKLSNYDSKLDQLRLCHGGSTVFKHAQAQCGKREIHTIVMFLCNKLVGEE